MPTLTAAHVYAFRKHTTWYITVENEATDSILMIAQVPYACEELPAVIARILLALGWTTPTTDELAAVQAAIRNWRSPDRLSVHTSQVQQLLDGLTPPPPSWPSTITVPYSWNFSYMGGPVGSTNLICSPNSPRDTYTGDYNTGGITIHTVLTRNSDGTLWTLDSLFTRAGYTADSITPTHVPAAPIDPAADWPTSHRVYPVPPGWTSYDIFP